MGDNPVPMTKTTLELSASLRGATYHDLVRLHTAGSNELDVRVSYFNQNTGTFPELAGVVCQGVLSVNDQVNGPPDLYIRATSMGICEGKYGSDSYDDCLPQLTTLGHVNFVGTVQERLDDDNGHHVYLVHFRSWVGTFVAGGIATARICCAIPPWKAQTLDGIRLRATVQFIGNVVGHYPDTSGNIHLCILVTDVAFITPSIGQDSSTTSTVMSTTVPAYGSPRKRRLAQLYAATTASTVLAATDASAASAPSTTPTPSTPVKKKEVTKQPRQSKR